MALVSFMTTSLRVLYALNIFCCNKLAINPLKMLAIDSLKMKQMVDFFLFCSSRAVAGLTDIKIVLSAIL